MFSRKAKREPMPYVDKPDPWSSHSIILKWLATFPPGTKVLDVGTASGTIGRRCRQMSFILTGIEPESDWANQASSYYDSMLNSTLEDTPVDKLKGFGVVVCADVLEHMNNPGAALERLVSAQDPGSHFIISVPNFVNIWVRLNLVFGRFEYDERGILDKTHLRFFTRKRLEDMLKSTGLQLIEMEVTPIPLNLVHPFFENSSFGRGLHRFLAAITRAFPRLMGYQFVSLSRK